MGRRREGDRKEGRKRERDREREGKRGGVREGVGERIVCAETRQRPSGGSCMTNFLLDTFSN